MRILIVSQAIDSVGASQVSGLSVRCDSLARIAVRESQQALLVLAGESGDSLGRVSSLAWCRQLSLRPEQILNPVVLDGIVREFAPDAIVALGTMASLSVGQLPAGPPYWLDFDDDPFVIPEWASIPGEADPILWYRHRLLWALEGAAAASTADQLVALRIESGYFLRTADSRDLVFRLADPDSDGAPFASWCSRPQHRNATGRVLSRAEISDWVRCDVATRALADRESLPLLRLANRIRGVRASVRSAIRWVWDTGAAALRSPALAAATIRFWSTSFRSHGVHSTLKDQREVEPAGTRRPRVLIVMPFRVFPPRHGGAARLLAQLPIFAEFCDLHMLRIDARGECRIERSELEKFCVGVEFHHWNIPAVGAPRSGALPPSVSVYSDEKLAWRIRRCVMSEGIDVVQFECAEMGQFLPAAAPARTILVEYDVAFRSFRRRLRLKLTERTGDVRFRDRGIWDLARLFVHEIRACRDADEVHAVSSVDAELLARYLPDGAARVRVVPNGVPVGTPSLASGVPPTQDALFVGNFDHIPNRDALEWLAQEIWPRVLEQLPEARLTVVGARLPDSFRWLNDCVGIDVAGEVEDLQPIYRSHRVVLAPIRAGSGTRVKILEAFAAGTPVISTCLGAEGLEVEDRRHILLADDAATFASRVTEALNSPELRFVLSSAAARFVADQYDVRVTAMAAVASHARLAAKQERSRTGAHSNASPGTDLPISVIIPIFHGGALLRRTLMAIKRQCLKPEFEIVCVDSGHSEADIQAVRESGARLVQIAPEQFNHGLTRDLGAQISGGRILVFLNQDAVPVDDSWLARLTEPFFSTVSPAAVQGGIRDFPESQSPLRRFFWDSGGPRFNFTRESRAWIMRMGGIGFSTVNCAMRRDVWAAIPFGWMPILEDKVWQQRAREREHRIIAVEEAAVFHTHSYDLPGLVRRSIAEGEGWRRVGERYPLRYALADAASRSVWRDWWAGVCSRRIRTAAEFLFPLARPFGLWRGNARAGREIR